MNVTQLDTRTDYYAKSNSTMFSLAEKLEYYNEAHGILHGLILNEQEDRNETEQTKTTIANQREYHEPSRIHHINWLKINYGNGFIPARYMSEADQISQYGNELETNLTQWSQSSPVYWWKGNHLFVVPAPSTSQAGADRMKLSVELLPNDLDRTTNMTPLLIPINFHYLLSAYAALSWLDEDDPLWKKAKRKWDEGVALMLDTMFPRVRYENRQAHIPNDAGYDY